MEKLIEKYLKMATDMNVTNAVAVGVDEIVFDGRTLLKCMFGCSSWGKGCTCPSKPGFPSSDELEILLKKYTSVIIIHSTDKKISQDVSFELEREAFLDGDALAFSMSDCAICDDCAGYTGEECRNVRKARPSFHSVGIDIFSTVKKLGLPLETLRNRDDMQNWYSAVWLNS
ncbi:MAG: DUF2284 domain-containing protein [Oscillospiraceae bacterium]|nr:DUF2284 domain-containing protein [Oscillospiraceae bacterium]